MSLGLDIELPDIRRSVALEVVARFLGVSYKWGGDDPIEGVDCSGLIVEALKASGDLPTTGDWTARGLCGRFSDPDRVRTVLDVQAGDLVFYGSDSANVTHVEMVYRVFRGRGTVNRAVWTIGASGGGSRIRTRSEAATANAYVKIRPLRLPVLRILDPFMICSVVAIDD